MTTKTYRIGQIVPSSNTTMETEIPAHSARMRMMHVTPEELKRMSPAEPEATNRLNFQQRFTHA